MLYDSHFLQHFVVLLWKLLKMFYRQVEAVVARPLTTAPPPAILNASQDTSLREDHFAEPAHEIILGQEASLSVKVFTLQLSLLEFVAFVFFLPFFGLVCPVVITVVLVFLLVSLQQRWR